MSNVDGHWAINAYENYKRKTGDVYDIVYLDETGQEIAFMVLIQTENGGFRLRSNEVFTSHANIDWRNFNQRQSYVQSHYGVIYTALRELAQRLIIGIEKPVL